MSTEEEKYVDPAFRTLHVEPIEAECCPECGSARLMRDYECAEIVCMECGIVLASNIVDRGPEWRAFTNEQKAKRTRVGFPSTYTIHDKGLSTMIDQHDRDFHGKNLPPEQKAQMYRLRKWQRRTRVWDATERNLAFALSEMAKTIGSLNLPNNVYETASIIYRRVVRNGTIRGRTIQGLAVAAIYLACRQCRIPRTLEEIAKASNLKKKRVGQDYRFLAKELNHFIPLVKPNQYIAKFSRQLEMRGEAEEIAHKIAMVANELRLTSGRLPTGIAAAAIYIASTLTGFRITQMEIAQISQITEVTIRNRYKDLVKRLMFQVSL